FFQRRVCAQVSQSHLPRQLLERAQVCNKILSLAIVGVRIRIAGYFRDGVQRAVRCAVITEHAVALTHLLERAKSVWFRTCTVPHFLPLNEKCVPVIVMRVGAEDPISSLLRWWSRHRGFERTIHIAASNAKQNVRVSSASRSGIGKGRFDLRNLLISLGLTLD